MLVSAACSGSPPPRGSALDGIAAISAGTYHTCALTTQGGVKCWGANGSGQLGDGTTTNRATPVAVSGLGSGVAAVSAGAGHTCALTTNGGVKCWGINYKGQLGDGTTTETGCICIPTPVDVSGLTSGVTSLSAGYFSTCAVTAEGAVKCWGLNNVGQLGDGTTTDRLTPVDVSGLSGVAAVSVGLNHTCALTTEGGVKCWGQNTLGELGDGTTTDRRAPVDVFGLSSGVAAVTTSMAAEDTCAVTTGGGVKCWGSAVAGVQRDSDGANGATATTGQGGVNNTTPVDVSGLTSGAAAVSAGQDHVCALATGGGVKCWGRNVLGGLGDGTTTARTAPVDVSGLGRGAAAVSVGAEHTCALTTSGGVKCWGINYTGQLGNGTATTTGCLCIAAPVDVLATPP